MKRRADMAYAHGKPLPMHLQAARRKYVAMAEAWTAEQADRLGCDPDDVLTVIRSGRLPEDIEGMGVSRFGAILSRARIAERSRFPWRGKAA